ncbi:MAG: hypothetical protein FWC70_10790 [Defluviitaleaceae bacterium]|nr:hypothetical protein [Defluviitaleaceae bacterium]
MREEFDALKSLLKQRHDERVAKTPDRIRYAIAEFNKNDIEFSVKNHAIGHIHAWTKGDNKVFQFWADTGKILGSNKRGIHAFIGLLKASRCATQKGDSQ